MMEQFKNIAGMAMALVLLAGCNTQTLPVRTDSSTPVTLYERLGGIEAITAVVDGLILRINNDPVLQWRFAGGNIARFKEKLVLQLASATGGPQKYTGKSMQVAHKGMDVTEKEYDALIADLVSTLDSLNVPSREQQELLALLAPLKAHIVVPQSAVQDQLVIMEGYLKRIEHKLDALETSPTPVKRTRKKQKRIPQIKQAVQLEGGPKPTKWTPEEKKIVASLIKRYETASKAEDGSKRRDLLGAPLLYTRFLADDGSVLDLKDLQGKPLVLVIMRGFSGTFCLQCSTQLIAITRSIDDFRKRNTPIYVVYPGDANTVIPFVNGIKKLDKNFRLPFSLLLDVDLVAVKEFLIEASLAKPTTMILDKEGVVRWAYVGRQPADRPSMQTILKQLDNVIAKQQ